MRKINLIVIHCTATQAKTDVTVKDLREWHRQRGFNDVGYHYLIKRDGTVEKGRDESKAGAHAFGYNAESIGIALAGGVDGLGKAQDNFMHIQYDALSKLLRELYAKYGKIKTIGHNEISDKDCPCFSVPEFLRKMEE